MTTLKKILYVEDEPDIQVIAQIALEDVGGFTVQICGSGQEALEVFESFAPDMLLLDVMMPGMDGPSTLKAIREHPQGRDIPALFMTAKVQLSEIEEYKALGAVDVIPKPFDPMTLADQVKAVWQQHH